MESYIKIDNLKCGGCANTIEKGLLSIQGVDKVEVVQEKSEVIVSHKGTIDLDLIKEKLNHMGYPETGTTEGFEKLTRNIKSYVSCAIGRIDNKEEVNN